MVIILSSDYRLVEVLNLGATILEVSYSIPFTRGNGSADVFFKSLGAEPGPQAESGLGQDPAYSGSCSALPEEEG